MALSPFSQSARADNLRVANFGFELPSFTDGAFENYPSLVEQGGYGWTWNNNGAQIGGIFNPSVTYYAGAAGNGTPAGAEGAQVGYLFRGGAFASQTLAGNDGIPGNADDPILTALTTYTLTLAVGDRLPGGANSFPFGNVDLALLAGSTVIAEDSTIGDPGAGLFADHTITVNSAFLNPSLYGQPLTIRIIQTQPGDFAADLDNVRLNAVTVPEPSSARLLALGLVGFALSVFRKTRPTSGRVGSIAG